MFMEPASNRSGSQLLAPRAERKKNYVAKEEDKKKSILDQTIKGTTSARYGRCVTQRAAAEPGNKNLGDRRFKKGSGSLQEESAIESKERFMRDRSGSQGTSRGETSK